MKQSRPTAVSLVFELLVKADDFLNGKQLVEGTRLSANHISAALYSLKKYKAIDFVEGDDTLWWFATPGTDTRAYTIKNRVECTKIVKHPRKGKHDMTHKRNRFT